MIKGMDKTTIVKLHQEAANYFKLAAMKCLNEQTPLNMKEEETWYNVCCWLYARLGEADEKV